MSTADTNDENIDIGVLPDALNTDNSPESALENLDDDLWLPKTQGNTEPEPTEGADDEPEPEKAIVKLEPLKNSNVILVDGAEPLPEGPVNMGLDIAFDVPNEAQQRAGFYVANPGSFIVQFQGQYKYFKAKGQPHPSDSKPDAGIKKDEGGQE